MINSFESISSSSSSSSNDKRKKKRKKKNNQENHEELFKRRKSKIQDTLNHLKESFNHEEDDSIIESNSSSSSNEPSILIGDHIDEFIKELDLKLTKLRYNDDDKLQILLFGKNIDFESITIENVIEIGEILCNNNNKKVEMPQRKDLLWIDFVNHSIEDLDRIRHSFGIHPVTIEDCIEECREKTEVFTKYHLVVANEMFYRTGSTAIEIAQTTIVTFSNVTLSFRSHLRSKSFLPVVYRLLHGQQTKGKIPSTNWVLYAFLDQILDRFQVFVDQIVQEIHVLDDLVLTLPRREQRDLLRRIAIARRRLAALRSTLWAKKELLESLSKNSILMTDSVKAYMRDVLDDATSMLERLSVSSEVLNHLDNTYLTRLSLEVAQAGEVMNGVMKKFSAVATIFIPLSTLAGLFGMNVVVPGQFNDNLYWFFGITIFMFIISITMCFYFKKQGWF